MRIYTVFLCTVLTAASLAAAELPYAGKWKMNPAKSDFGATTVTYKCLPADEWQATADGISYKFKMDAKDYPDGLGDMAAWKPIDANTWQTTWKVNGKVLTTDTLKVAADDKGLTVNAKGTRANGEAIDETITFQRVSGGPGLAGKWQTKAVKTSSPGLLELTPSGTDGLTLKEPANELTCDAKLDGKDYPCSGPTIVAGWTVAMSKAGARSLDLTVKKDGKAFYKVTYTASADGKSLTETGGAIATGEKVKVFYDRQ